MKKNKAKIGEFHPGKKSMLSDEDMDLNNAKFRVTLWLDLSVLDKFRAFAKASGGKYQTMVNECLQEFAEDFLNKRAQHISKVYLKKAG